jgi:ssDNA-binding Zn-finger/Zn-ribbon topoisomerase 1
LKPEVQEMLAKAKANREAAEADLRRGKEFPMESCPKCGGLVKVYTSAKGYKFEQCEAVRKDKTGRVHAEGGHHYKRLP